MSSTAEEFVEEYGGDEDVVAMHMRMSRMERGGKLGRKVSYWGMRQNIDQLILKFKDGKKYRMDCEAHSPILVIKAKIKKGKTEDYIEREIDMLVPLKLPIGEALTVVMKTANGVAWRGIAIPVSNYSMHIYGDLEQLRREK